MENQKFCKNISMIEYNKINLKLSDTQLNKLRTAIKNETGATLRMNIKIFHGNNSPHELLLTTRQTTKLRNAIEDNMSTDIKLSETNSIWRIFSFIIK